MYKQMTLIFLLFMGCTNCTQSGPACVASREGLKPNWINGQSLGVKQLVLTVDNSPSPYTDEIADYLSAQNIKATFFIRGTLLSEFGTKQLLGKLRTNHQIGNGGYNAAKLTRTVQPLVEIRLMDYLLMDYFVQNIFFLRPSDSNEKLAKYLNEGGLGKYIGPIGADFESAFANQPSSVNAKNSEHGLDVDCASNNQSPDSCTQKYYEAIESVGRGIIRFTDGSPYLTSLLRQLIPTLAAGGYTFTDLNSVPEIRKELALREVNPSEVLGGARDQPTCDDYRRI